MPAKKAFGWLDCAQPPAIKQPRPDLRRLRGALALAAEIQRLDPHGRRHRYLFVKLSRSLTTEDAGVLTQPAAHRGLSQHIGRVLITSDRYGILFVSNHVGDPKSILTAVEKVFKELGFETSFTMEGTYETFLQMG